MPAQRRNCYAIWADRLRLRSCRGGGKVQVQEQLVDVVSVECSCRTWAYEAKDFKLFAGRYSCDDGLVIAVDVMRPPRYWMSDWA
jgi:hypothetical protein